MCLLKKSLYGLKQAPQCWNKRLMQFMKNEGFENSVADPCLFYRKQNGCKLYVAIYVDDGLVVGSNEKEMSRFLSALQQEFDVTTGTLDNFLGMKIQQNKNGSVMISQEWYTKKILKKFGMLESNAVKTPIGREEDDLEEAVSPNEPYREAVGSLMYLSISSRPDITFALNKVSRTM